MFGPVVHKTSEAACDFLWPMRLSIVAMTTGVLRARDSFYSTHRNIQRANVYISLTEPLDPYGTRVRRVYANYSLVRHGHS